MHRSVAALLLLPRGPAINLLFGVLVYGAVFATGLDRGSANLISSFTGRPIGEPEAVQVGWVAEDGAGAAGGIMPGDILVSINGDSIRHWSTFQIRILTSANRTLELVVERDGVLQTLSVKPDAIPSVRGDIGEIRVSSGHTTIVSHIEEGSLAAEAGLQVGDIIESINGERLYSVPYFGSGVWHPSADWIDEKYKALYNNINEHRDAVTLGIRRGDEVFTRQLPVDWQVIAGVQERSIAEEAGIQNGDMLLTLNGASVNKTTLYSQLKAAVDQPVEIGLMRKGDLKQVTLSSETQSSEEDPEAVMLGLKWQASFSGMELAPQTAPLPEYNLLTGFGKGVEATWLTFTAIGRTLQQLIGGEVSPKLLSGPVGITHMTGRFSRLGLSSLIFFVGFISINLAIVNLLPIPIADGGQLLFFAVEKIRGKPMPRRAQEIVQQVSVCPSDCLLPVRHLVRWHLPD